MSKGAAAFSVSVQRHLPDAPIDVSGCFAHGTCVDPDRRLTGHWNGAMLVTAKGVSRPSANKETLETGWSNQLLYPRTLAALDQGNRDLPPGA